MSNVSKTGKLYGVGVGPGDPELMTLKALRVLKDAPVIAAPKSSNIDADSNALEIIKGSIGVEGKVILELGLPMTKDRAVLKAGRDKAAAELAGMLEKGLDVAFITLGDPMLYSTFSYLVPLVRERLPHARVEAVAGVTSFCAAASAAMLPLAEGSESVAIEPCAYKLEDVRRALKTSDTVILLKVNKALDGIIKLLEEESLLNNAVFVSRASCSDAEIVTDLKTLKGRDAGYFSLIIVKKGSI
ncbi:MAG: precorrin-2 C(20)-methyltransferase [Deltaproteobacteria bacterium]|nr:precorrin-2 C(20)-methyltransferase [Deltaproteobacteria bacterium]